LVVKTAVVEVNPGLCAEGDSERPGIFWPGEGALATYGLTSSASERGYGLFALEYLQNRVVD